MHTVSHIHGAIFSGGSLFAGVTNNKTLWVLVFIGAEQPSVGGTGFHGYS